VTNPHEYYISIDLAEITARNETARHMITGFAAEMPPLADFWRLLETALADTTALSAEVSRLAGELATARRDTADLLAAIRAPRAAHAGGEADPLWYVRDELNARQARSPGHGSMS
jgi:hypothetical protein